MKRMTIKELRLEFEEYMNNAIKENKEEYDFDDFSDFINGCIYDFFENDDIKYRLPKNFNIERFCSGYFIFKLNH